MRIQTKTTLLFTIVTGTLIILLSVLVYTIVSKHAFNDFYKRLEIRAYIAARAVLERDEAGSGTYQSIRKQHLEVLPGEREYFIRTDTLTRRSAEGLGLPYRFLNKVVSDKRANFQQAHYYYTGVYYSDNEGNFVVVVAAKNEDGARTLLFLKKTLVLSCIASVLLVFTIGNLFARQIFSPVRKIIVRVREISADSLHKRLELAPGKDEVSELGDTFNSMLDRLETSFEVQNNFVSNASHEFRTPLTTIIGEADYILQKDRDTDAYKASVKLILTEAEKLQHLTTSLLSLAQTGFDGKISDFTLFSFAELFWETKNTIDKMHPENNVMATFDIEQGLLHTLKLKGNYQLLKIALTNVILNACKYSSNNYVTISADVRYKHLFLTVADKGIGIPNDEIKYIFEPFFRASNVARFEGYGIGLPLTYNIVRMHRGNIEVLSDEGRGTHFTIKLPVAEYADVHKR